MHEDLLEVVQIHKAIMGELDKGIIGLDDVKLKTNIAFWAEIPTTFSAKQSKRVNAGLVYFRGVPGVGKTYFGLILSKVTNTTFVRIQGRADLTPGDIVGCEIFNPKTGEFETRPGAIVKAQILLIDEGTRIPPKTQSAFLEANQDRTVTIGDTTFDMSEFYFAILTANPVDTGGGTYPLEAANLDRFTLLIDVGYLSPNEEQRLVSFDIKSIEIQQLVEWQRVVALRSVVNKEVALPIYLEKYIRRLVRSSRSLESQEGSDNPQKSLSDLVEEFVVLGASPRSDMCWGHLAKVHALLADGRDVVYPEDIQSLAKNILMHRLLLRNTAKSRGVTAEDVINDIVSSVPIP